MLKSKNLAFLKEFDNLSDQDLLELLKQKSDQQLIDLLRMLLEINRQYQQEMVEIEQNNQKLKDYIQTMQSEILDYLD